MPSCRKGNPNTKIILNLHLNDRRGFSSADFLCKCFSQQTLHEWMMVESMELLGFFICQCALGLLPLSPAEQLICATLSSFEISIVLLLACCTFGVFAIMSSLQEEIHPERKIKTRQIVIKSICQRSTNIQAVFVGWIWIWTLSHPHGFILTQFKMNMLYPLQTANTVECPSLGHGDRRWALAWAISIYYCIDCYNHGMLAK